MIIKKLIPPSKYKIKSPFKMNPKFFIVHNTYNDATARNEIAYMSRNNNKVSFHYAIDDKEIIQGIPENRSSYNAGSSYGNNNGISVEICFSKSGGPRFIEAEKRTAKFLAYKLRERNWNVKDHIKKHQDFNGKYCPHRTLDMGWQRFLNMIQEELDNMPSKWAEKNWEWAMEKGYLDGTRPKEPVTREEMATIIRRIVENG